MSLFQKNWFLSVLIFVLAIAQYANTRNHDFAWDDVIVIVENSRVQKGWDDIPELFQNIKTSKTENRYGYRPISLLSFATDVEFFGVNSKASHHISILLYGILCVIIFLFLQSVFAERRLVNFLVTILFVVHPLHTEVVANIKSRDEILAMSFGLVAMLFYLQALKKHSIINYLLFTLLLLVAFLSKENAVVFCGVAMLLAWYKHPPKTSVGWFKRVIPILGSFVLLIAIRFYVYSDWFFQSTDQELFDKGVFLQDGFVGNPLFGIESDFLLKWLNIIYLHAFHLWKFLIPHPLVHDYGYNYLNLVDFADYRAYLSLLLLFLVVYVAVRGVLKRSAVGFGLAFFAATASIYLHIAGLAPDVFAERFLFVSSLGLSIVFVELVFSISTNARFRFAAAGFLLLISAGYSVYGNARNLAWESNETLFKTDLKILKNGARANYNYALLLHGKYYNATPEEQVQLQDSILYYYEITTAITDRLLPAFMDLGGAYMEFGKPEKAKEVFQKTIELHPTISAPYVQMGKYYMSLKDFGAAVQYFEKAIENGDKNSDYYYFLAISQFNSEQRGLAIQTLKKGEATSDVTAPYYTLFVNLHLKLMQNNEAQEVLRRGLNKFPSNTELLSLKARFQED